MIHIAIPAITARKPIAPLVRMSAAIPANVEIAPTHESTLSAPPGLPSKDVGTSVLGSPGFFGAS